MLIQCKFIIVHFGRNYAAVSASHILLYRYLLKYALLYRK